MRARLRIWVYRVLTWGQVHVQEQVVLHLIQHLQTRRVLGLVEFEDNVTNLWLQLQDNLKELLEMTLRCSSCRSKVAKAHRPP